MIKIDSRSVLEDIRLFFLDCSKERNIESLDRHELNNLLYIISGCLEIGDISVVINKLGKRVNNMITILEEKYGFKY